MHLTLINFFKKTVPGHIFRGKRRLVRQVKMSHIQMRLDEFAVQEKNMALLRKPYLTLVRNKNLKIFL